MSRRDGVPGDERLQAEAFDAAWAADHDRALAALHNGPWPGSAVMRARIYARKGLLDRVLAECRRATDARSEPEERFELATIAASLLGACGRRVEAILALHQAELLCADVDLTLIAQYRLATAEVEASSGNGREAAVAIAAGLELTEDRVDIPLLRAHRLEINHVRARLLELRAHLHALACDEAAHIADLCSAIETAKIVRRRDSWHDAELVAHLSSVIGMSPRTSARRLFVAANNDVRWNAHLEAHETVVRFNVARAEMLFGGCEDFVSLRTRGAPSLAARLALDADRLLFDVWDGARHYARELDFAASLAHTIDWSDVTGEEILGLATLALLLAPYDVARARDVRALYDRVLTNLSREARGFLEQRRVAFDDLSAACIAKAEGDHARAGELLDGCIAFWGARGMAPWCTIAALERFTLSRDQADLTPARRFVREWPRSRFASRLRVALGTAFDDPGNAFPYLGVAAPPPAREVGFG